MDYEKKLALAKEALDSGSYDKETIEYIFPELTESEDERIRKDIINYFVCQSMEEPTRKSIHKRWIEWLKDINIPDNLKKEGIVSDIISLINEAPLVLQKDKENMIAWLEKQCEQKPILDVEIPFGTDSELVEEAITIPDGCYAIIEDNKVILRKGEKKSSWSEEDERIFININLYIRKAGDYPHFDKENIKKAINWLESLKDRYTWKPSREQMEHLIRVIECSNEGWNVDILESLYNNLKKLREG